MEHRVCVQKVIAKFFLGGGGGEWSDDRMST